MRTRDWLLILNNIFIASAMGLTLGHAYAQTPMGELSFKKGDIVDFSAREVIYDSQTNTVEARGNVSALWKDQTVFADVFRYNTKEDKLEAFGNIRLVNKEGYAVRTNKIEFSGDFKEALTHKLASRLPNGSVIAAEKFKRQGGRYNQFYNASYAPCASCLEGGEKPLWSIRSKQITHDEQKRYITARDLTFNLWGQPVLWVPWFAYPDPTIDRKSGILSPSFGYKDKLGLYASLPVFLTLGEHADLTLTPYLYEKNNPRLESRLRQQFKGGGLDLHGSIVRDKVYTYGDLKWDVDSSFDWRMAEKWYLSSHVRLASDEKYLNEFDIEKEIDKAGFLRSDITLERRSYNSWLQLQGLYYQTQNNYIKQDYIPTVLPEATFDWLSPKDKLGGNTYLSLQSRSLYRDLSSYGLNKNIFAFDAPKTSHRFMAQAGWNKSWIGLLGEEFSFDASLNHIYWLNEEYYSQDIDYSGKQNILRPKIETELSYPLIRKSQKNTVHIEPVIQAVWSPDYNQEDYKAIPNEDSHIFELTANNLFSSNRFSGYDRDEGGLRINYGLRGSIDFSDGKYSRFAIGQVWRPDYKGEFQGLDNSGTNKDFSDLVFQIEASPYPWLNLSSNGRFSQDDFSARRLDFGGSIGPSSFKLSGYYSWFDDLEDHQKTEEMKIGLSARITDQMLFSGYILNDLQATSSKPKEAKANIFWENESVAIGGYYKREWNKADEEDSLGIQLNLKTLGAFDFDL